MEKIPEIKLYDYYDFNEEFTEESTEEKRAKTSKEYVIQMFGKDINGKSYSIMVNGFEPYFYIKIPARWKNKDKVKFIRWLKKEATYTIKEWKSDTFVSRDVKINDWLSGNISFQSKKKIKTISLNDFIKDEKIKKINFCKMNIEGSEKYIVHNSNKFFNICENIAIECHDFLNLPEFKTKKKVEIFLIKKGYKILKLKNKDYINYYSRFYVYASKKEFIKYNKIYFKKLFH